MLVINVYGTISKSCNYYANIGFEMESVEAVIIVNLCDFEHATTILLLL